MHPLDIKTALFAKHAQHVVLIHFPIAPFIIGVLFDFLSQWMKRRQLAAAVHCNLFVAALTTIPVLHGNSRLAVGARRAAALTAKQEKAIKDAVPTAHVVELLNANHFVFLSIESDVLREIRDFVAIEHSGDSGSITQQFRPVLQWSIRGEQLTNLPPVSTS